MNSESFSILCMLFMVLLPLTNLPSVASCPGWRNLVYSVSHSSTGSCSRVSISLAAFLRLYSISKLHAVLKGCENHGYIWWHNYLSCFTSFLKKSKNGFVFLTAAELVCYFHGRMKYQTDIFMELSTCYKPKVLFLAGVSLEPSLSV